MLCSGVGPCPRVDYNRYVLIKVIPLTLHGPAGFIDTFGVLDECAELTMVLQSVVDDLNIQGHDEHLCVATVMGDYSWNGKCVDFEVSGIYFIRWVNCIQVLIHLLKLLMFHLHQARIYTKIMESVVVNISDPFPHICITA